MVDSLVAVLEPLVVVVEGDLEVVFVAAEAVAVETCSKVGSR